MIAPTVSSSLIWHGVILKNLMVAQIIALSVLFSDSNRLSGPLIEAMNKLLPSYGEASRGAPALHIEYSKSVVQSVLEKILGQSKVEDNDMQYLVKFMADNADGLAIMLMTVGFVLASLCIYGFISACSESKVLLISYGLVLLLLIAANLGAVYYLFSRPSKMPNVIIQAINESQQYYNMTSSEGVVATAVWNIIMTFNGTCCGFDGYAEFPTNGTLPLQCCNISNNSIQKTCERKEAASSKVTGCRAKIVDFVDKYLQLTLYLVVGVICFQVGNKF
ncbi:unnamed protein product [Rodentolepis nana]|uniref:Tetraspanin n=1 Tax=Rodentolepis nana TaxID=102285 RepID=A0A0R3TUM5_RODNA|nr:unnamed protein product [Rodentolepis nana]